MSKKISGPQPRLREAPMDGITSEDKQRISVGLLLYAKNARAAARASRGLFQEPTAHRLEEEADEIEQRLLPMFSADAAAVEEMAEREDRERPQLHLVED